jgi:hypothetical protein
MKRQGLVVSICLALLLVLSTVDAEARGCHNPLFLPFAIAGAVVGTAAAIATAVVPVPVYPAYSGPAYYAPAPGCCGPGPYYSRPVRIPGHYNPYGYWIPGRWR